MVKTLQHRTPTKEELDLIEKAVEKTTSSNFYLYIFLITLNIFFLIFIIINIDLSELDEIAYSAVALSITLALVFWQRMRVQDMTGTDIREARVTKHVGIASQRISGGGMPGAPKIDDKTVSLASGWPFLWGAPVEVLCLETECGYRFVFEMLYLNEYSVRTAGKAHFSLQKDIEAGRLEIGGAHYVVW